MCSEVKRMTGAFVSNAIIHSNRNKRPADSHTSLIRWHGYKLFLLAIITLLTQKVAALLHPISSSTFTVLSEANTCPTLRSRRFVFINLSVPDVAHGLMLYCNFQTDVSTAPGKIYGLHRL